VTPLGEILRDQIRRDGPIPFRRYMEEALYHPQFGYYRRDRFGHSGDFYTAEQMQPVFGILIAAAIDGLRKEHGSSEDWTVVELGAGRMDMSHAFAGYRYLPVDIGYGELPQQFTGVVFSNEFFDALPVHWVELHDNLWREMLVGFHDRFIAVPGPPVTTETSAYIEAYVPEGICRAEVSLEAARWMQRIRAGLQEGYIFTIDYGYTAKELVRFPEGTLMSYRRHTALDDVLADPGERDITAHVNFSALQASSGFETVRFEPLVRTLLDAGEADQFAAALGAGPDQEQRKLQLKTLLFGMGETFRTLLMRRLK
jgi:SAM-dependent MidA family methyltransferase